ncbi:MAG: hypothetical protein CVV24_05770 [Ignavibacteriae bacterium HGW-Ignavibacteriae-3]|nr:MAG: hypothetical protein CVV24_05770 [Ignavibacteriae bacterium HGW-Ignavibacteriae-3]
MFQETEKLFNMKDYLNKKFPAAVSEKNSYRIYTSAIDEFNSIRRGAGLRLNCSPVLIQMSGKDVLDFLNRVSTNAVNDMKSFEKRNTLFLNEKGRFIDRTTLISYENDFLLIGTSGENNLLLSWINKFIITEDIQTKDISENYLILDFIGPQSESFLSLMLGKEINTIDATVVRRFDIDGFTFHLFMNLESGGIKIYKLIIEKGKCAEFIDHLYNIKSVFDLNLVGDDAYEAFRIENGIPGFPNEINSETNPHEVNLISEVSSTKGCYIGQEVVARLDTYDKIQKQLYKIELECKVVQNSPIAIYNSAGNESGSVTTLSKDGLFSVQKGLALIRKKSLESGSDFIVKIDEEGIEVKVSGTAGVI